ncbi:MAG: DUF177 domain-containing protein [Bacilli bacterium]|nr:DUF177 domain-containing protein [Bacilli bacterium]
MQINTNILEEGKTYHYSEDLDFSSETLNPILIRKIKDCHAEVDVTPLYFGHVRIIINIKSNVILPCSYTLEDVDYIIKGGEEFIFTDEKEEDDEEAGMIYEPKPIFSLDPYIFSLLIALVPPKVVKKGAKLPEGGKGYDVISEDEYYQRKATQVDHRWDKLNDIELDDGDE